MKKLMVVLAAVALAGAASAANFKWAVAEYDGISGGESGTAYLVFGNDFSQTSFLTAYANGSSFSSLVADHQLDSFALDEYGEHATGQQFSTAKVDATGAGGLPTSLDAYIVLLSGNQIFVSETKNAAAQPSSAPLLTYSEGTASAKAATVFKSGDTFGGAGWYTTASVPEPTSGLLLLLGMAGLALRRRRA